MYLKVIGKLKVLCKHGGLSNGIVNAGVHSFQKKFTIQLLKKVPLKSFKLLFTK